MISEVCCPPLGHAITECQLVSLVFVNIQASKHSTLWSLGGVSTTSTILSSSNSRLDPRQHGSKTYRLYLVFIYVLHFVDAGFPIESPQRFSCFSFSGRSRFPAAYLPRFMHLPSFPDATPSTLFNPQHSSTMPSLSLSLSAPLAFAVFSYPAHTHASPSVNR